METRVDADGMRKKDLELHDRVHRAKSCLFFYSHNPFPKVHTPRVIQFHGGRVYNLAGHCGAFQLW